MIDYDKQFNDIIAQIQAQYRGSNVAELIKGIIEIKKKGVLRAYKSLIDDCLNLSTAKGDALDLWGYILGINRYVPRDSEQNEKEPFKQWNFNQSNFKHLIFLQVRDHLYHRLDDDAFRNLLLLFLQRQYIFPSPAEAQSLIDDYISDKYGEINIFDTQKMGMAVEFSFKDYPEWMRWYILLKDIIPRPAGVKIDMIIAPEPIIEPEPELASEPELAPVPEPIIEPAPAPAPEPEPIIEPEPYDGLIFTAQEANSSVCLDGASLQLEYRTNTITEWQNYTLGTEINLANIDDWVEMRNRGLQTNINGGHRFTMTGKIAASGNIQYLLDKTGELLSVSAYCYKQLFYGCKSLTTAPELPATTLANDCYYEMFRYCTSLTIAPELPATTLASDCYTRMFGDCDSLTIAPELPATTLADNCYLDMFRYCTSLTTAPSILPAATLADSCYAGMFLYCASLITTPALPATTLADSCYDRMFAYCTSLTTAPSILPATTLADSCYNQMFLGCSNLTSAPKLPAATLLESCYHEMFDSCTNLKVNENGVGNEIFTCPSTSGLNYSVSYMFYGTGGSFTGTPTEGNTYYCDN